MAEGGQLPWKVQHVDTSRVCDYSKLSEPLPAPPRDFEWRKEENKKKRSEWKLVKTGNDDAEKRKYTVQVGVAWNATTGRVVPTLVPVPKMMKKKEEEPCDSTTCTTPTSTASPSSPTAAVEGVDYLHHTVLPSDTLPGLCLRYKTNATTLRQVNKFSGSNLHLAPSTLVIPLSNTTTSSMIRVQDTSTPEYKMQVMLSQFPHLCAVERKAYLELSDWNLQEAMKNAEEDEEWEKEENEKSSEVSKKTTMHVHVGVPVCNTMIDPVKDKGGDGKKELMEPLLRQTKEIELEMPRRDYLVK